MIAGIVLAIAAQVTAYFSPHGGAQAAMIDVIDHAVNEIHIQFYSYTSEPIDDALVAAKARGVKVYAILDAGANRTNKGSQRWELAKSGADVKCDFAHPISHAKIVIADGHAVVCGSFNASAQAELKNSEDLVVIESEEVAAQFLANWQKHELHAKPCGK